MYPGYIKYVILRHFFCLGSTKNHHAFNCAAVEPYIFNRVARSMQTLCTF